MFRTKFTQSEQPAQEETQLTQPFITEQPAPAKPMPELPVMIQTLAKLNLRSGPGMENSIVKIAPKGTELAAKLAVKGWYEVQYDGQTLYCMEKFAKIIE